MGGHVSRQSRQGFGSVLYQLYKVSAILLKSCVCPQSTPSSVWILFIPLPPLLTYNNHKIATATYLTSCTICQVNKAPSKMKHSFVWNLLQTFRDFSTFLLLRCLHFFLPPKMQNDWAWLLTSTKVVKNRVSKPISRQFENSVYPAFTESPTIRNI